MAVFQFGNIISKMVVVLILCLFFFIILGCLAIRVKLNKVRKSIYIETQQFGIVFIVSMIDFMFFSPLIAVLIWLVLFAFFKYVVFNPIFKRIYSFGKYLNSFAALFICYVMEFIPMKRYTFMYVIEGYAISTSIFVVVYKLLRFIFNRGNDSKYVFSPVLYAFVHYIITSLMVFTMWLNNSV